MLARFSLILSKNPSFLSKIPSLLIKIPSLANQPFSSSQSSHHFSSTFLPSSPPWSLLNHPKSFSSNQGNNGEDTWKFSAESENKDPIFESEEVKISSFDVENDLFEGMDKEIAPKEGGGEVVWETSEGYKPWSIGEEDDEKSDVFGGREDLGEMVGFEGEEVEFDKERKEEEEKLQQREQELLATINGPNRAFGDLIAASGITEDMIDSLILLRDVRGVKGLPPLSEIEDKAIAKLNATSSRAEVERKKQEDIAKARVRKVDAKGRAYGTGRRKCSVARVWVQPGDGKFIVNEKQFDAYFPILDHRADLLRPFTVTNTLGLWDVTCTVKGGGVSGQVGAVRLGISRALQCWEPGLRPYLKAAGFLTRDPRAVERKKPGKAKARKSFQWVKR